MSVTDPKEIEARIPEFAERAGYYFANWDRLYAAWVPKVRALIDELETISFSPLPEREDMAIITEGRGTGSALDLLSTYHRLVDLTLKLWQHHFEFLNLGYAAYLDFFGCCKPLLPSIPTRPSPRWSPIPGELLPDPDDEIKKLAGWRGSGSPTSSQARSRPNSCWPGCAATAGRQVAGRLGGGPAALVQLLGRDHLLPQRQGVAGVSGHPASASCAPTSSRCSAASRWSGRSKPSSPSATGSWTSTPS